MNYTLKFVYGNLVKICNQLSVLPFTIFFIKETLRLWTLYVFKYNWNSLLIFKKYAENYIKLNIHCFLFAVHFWWFTRLFRDLKIKSWRNWVNEFFLGIWERRVWVGYSIFFTAIPWLIARPISSLVRWLEQRSSKNYSN